MRYLFCCHRKNTEPIDRSHIDDDIRISTINVAQDTTDLDPSIIDTHQTVSSYLGEHRVSSIDIRDQCQEIKQASHTTVRFNETVTLCTTMIAEEQKEPDEEQELQHAKHRPHKKRHSVHHDSNKIILLTKEEIKALHLIQQREKYLKQQITHSTKNNTEKVFIRNPEAFLCRSEYHIAETILGHADITYLSPDTNPSLSFSYKTLYSYLNTAHRYWIKKNAALEAQNNKLKQLNSEKKVKQMIRTMNADISKAQKAAIKTTHTLKKMEIPKSMHRRKKNIRSWLIAKETLIQAFLDNCFDNSLPNTNYAEDLFSIEITAANQEHSHIPPCKSILKKTQQNTGDNLRSVYQSAIRDKQEALEELTLKSEQYQRDLSDVQHIYEQVQEVINKEQDRESQSILLKSILNACQEKSSVILSLVLEEQADLYQEIITHMDQNAETGLLHMSIMSDLLAILAIIKTSIDNQYKITSTDIKMLHLELNRIIECDKEEKERHDSEEKQAQEIDRINQELTQYHFSCRRKEELLKQISCFEEEIDDICTEHAQMTQEQLTLNQLLTSIQNELKRITSLELHQPID